MNERELARKRKNERAIERKSERERDARGGFRVEVRASEASEGVQVKGG